MRRQRASDGDAAERGEEEAAESRSKISTGPTRETRSVGFDERSCLREGEEAESIGTTPLWVSASSR